MSYPNIVIAGAPKCGTTSVFGFLADHPDVCASSLKETCFLIDQDYTLYNPDRNVATQGVEAYSQFFDHCRNRDAQIYLEATPDYLYQKTPLTYLPQLDPVPHIIFILRRPAERVYSMFQFARNNMSVIDSSMTFSAFIDAVRNPESASGIDRPMLLDVLNHSRYASYIKPWIEVFGRDRIHVFLFEDLVTDSRQFMKSLCREMHIDPDFYDDYTFEKRNVTRSVRFQLLHRIKRRLRKAGGSSIPGNRYAGELYRRINAPPARNSRSRDDENLIQSLELEFMTDNQELSELLGIDLSCWRS